MGWGVFNKLISSKLMFFSSVEAKNKNIVNVSNCQQNTYIQDGFFYFNHNGGLIIEILERQASQGYYVTTKPEYFFNTYLLILDCIVPLKFYDMFFKALYVILS